jgi:hypothetical protein
MYTIVPLDVVFHQPDAVKVPQELTYRGQRVLAEQLPEPGRFRLVQLISTDPSLYLDPAFQPGAIIRFPASPVPQSSSGGAGSPAPGSSASSPSWG